MIMDVHVSNPRYPSSGAGIQCLHGSFAQGRAPTPHVGDSVLYHSLSWFVIRQVEKFSLATNERFKGRHNDYHERT